jgi:predicted small lipoprotein YifL
MAAVALLALALAACGRKGDPLPPPDPNASATPRPSNDASNGLAMGHPSNPPIQRPTTPFILDPLIKSQ